MIDHHILLQILNLCTSYQPTCNRLTTDAYGSKWLEGDLTNSCLLGVDHNPFLGHLCGRGGIITTFLFVFGMLLFWRAFQQLKFAEEILPL